MKQSVLPNGHSNRPGYVMYPRGLLFHTTNNWSPTANAEMHARYMSTTTNVVSWHVTVDAEESIQHIPFDESAWHAGDGTTGYYNRNYLGVEICCNRVKQGEPLDSATYVNAIETVAKICKQFNFKWDNVQPHKIVKGKDCPHNTLFNHVEFKNAVFALINEWDNPRPLPEPSEWEIEFMKAKEWAIELKITDGSRPKDNVTREEMWTMLYRAKGGN